MKRRNWIALSVVAVVAVILCTTLWVVFVDRDEPPGATGSVAGALPESSAITSVPPER
ncbi:hypothetical protein [Microvirga splendida]|uniref:Uncharacterized protein n=1 Tax=Microvirga splendida TaxID=2795727 RepID=A0ABS0Y3W9_9HYPH|nr:hypothetical protein [Microvirga splendida]MBJ6126999.1 hypothetical protein [Microvirga splendida]